MRVLIRFRDGTTMISKMFEIRTLCGGWLIAAHFFVGHPRTKKEVQVALVSEPDKAKNYYIYEEVT